MKAAGLGLVVLPAGFVLLLVLASLVSAAAQVFAKLDVALPAADAGVVERPKVDVNNMLSRPMSNHAQVQHAGQKWCAAAILEYMASSCRPRVFQCGDRFRLLCKDPKVPGNMIGLIVGERIITGFTAPAGYWERSNFRDGCVELAD
jgi:hypothetical protein